MAIELPPLRCSGVDYDDGGVDVSVSGSPGADGGIGISITITPPDSPISINIVPFFPFIIPGINWSFFFGPTHIEIQKEEIQTFFRPIFRWVADNHGWRVRDHNFLDLSSPSVRDQFRWCPLLAALAPSFMEDAHWILKCMKQKETDVGFQQRLVNQFIANACINVWTVEQTEALWDAIIQAIVPNPECLPQCVTAVQLFRYILSGHTVPQSAVDFVQDGANWDTSVLYCFPADFVPVGCIVPAPQPTPQPFPQPQACPPGMVRLQDGTCFCPLPLPQPQPRPLPQPQPRPLPQPQPSPQPQGCPPACQTQIDRLWQCCERALGEIGGIWNTINDIWNTINVSLTEIWENINRIYEFISQIDIRIETHIENWWTNIIKVYIDEMCERCKAQPPAPPPPDTQQETDCEEGIRKWGLWAECWLEQNTPETDLSYLDFTAPGYTRILAANFADVVKDQSTGPWVQFTSPAVEQFVNQVTGKDTGWQNAVDVSSLTEPYIFEARP